jgi:hemerythrin-like metal-binding protein
MSFFLVSEEFKTGIAEIDEQHEKICELINGLHTLIKTEPSLQLIYSNIENIISYIADHHLFEEALMLYNNYPQSAEHKKEHEHFDKTVRKLVAELKESTATSPMDVQMATRGPIGWFFTHTSKLDKHLADFIKARNEVA